jgi:hypothetical protein
VVTQQALSNQAKKSTEQLIQISKLPAPYKSIIQGKGKKNSVFYFQLSRIK